MGARFAKWRAVIHIADGLPSRACVSTNAHALARYAALCQEAGLVPIVEPEVLMDGPHSIERCEEVTTMALHAVFQACSEQRISLESMLLKPNVVVPGKASPRPASVQEVGTATLRCLRREMIAAVPGIVFLSGGQSDRLATAHLNAINRLPGPKPWTLGFSYGRALQDAALETWHGRDENVKTAQEALSHQGSLETEPPVSAATSMTWRRARRDQRQRPASGHDDSKAISKAVPQPSPHVKTPFESSENDRRKPALGQGTRAHDAYWRAANYLSVGQIYLSDNPLLKEPLKEHVKPRLLGHWGTTPGLNFIYAHLNRVIKRTTSTCSTSPGRGTAGPASSNAYLEGTYSEVYPNISPDEEGMKRLFTQFSFPGGIPSHVAPRLRARCTRAASSGTRSRTRTGPRSTTRT